MKLRGLALVLCALLIASATGCSSSSPAAAGPSDPAKMVCAQEAQGDIRAALGVRPTAPVTGTWHRPVYSCRYTYRSGSFELSVRDFESKGAMTAYFDRYVADHKRGSTANIGADEAVQLQDGSLIARRKLHVLVVDVADLPARFGSPPQSRSDTALALGFVVMGCWTGAS